MIDAETTYFAPNNFGHKAYASIGPLLLCYRQIAISNLSGNLISHALAEAPRTALTEAEFEKCIRDGLVVPLGFRSFFDHSSRQQYSPDLQVSTELDLRLLVDRELMRKRLVLPNEFKQQESCVRAIQFCKSNPIVANRLRDLFEHQRYALPLRYSQLAENSSALPDTLRAHVSDGASPSDKFACMFVYDHLNNQRGLMEFQQATNSKVAYTLHPQFRLPYEALELSSQTSRSDDLRRSSHAKIVADALIELVTRMRLERLTLDEILEFRVKHRKSLLQFFNRVLDTIDPGLDERRVREKVVATLRSEIEKLEWRESAIWELLMQLFSLALVRKVDLPRMPAAMYPGWYARMFGPKRSLGRALFFFLDATPK